MKISVVCPTCNSEEFIEPTLIALFNQTRMPDEVIFVDDGSTDNTVNFLKKFVKLHGRTIRCVICENDHRGPGASRNLGIEVALGEWIAFLDPFYTDI